jgi:mono/diheme cytochrome c family protein
VTRNTKWAALFILAGTFASPARGEVDFSKEIRPILEKTCVTCHGATRQKGGLRLDSKEAMMKGAKSGKVVVAGKAAESKLYQVLVLPNDDENRMPAEGDALPKAQIEKMKAWIDEGAKWPDGVVLGKPAAATTSQEDAGLPISEAEKAAVTKLQQAGILVMRLAQNSNWLRIDFSLRGKEVKADELGLLKDMPNVIELNLGGTTVNDSMLVSLKPLQHLSILKLHNTAITDAGLNNLLGFSKLVSLNIYGTGITDKGIEQLRSIKSLKRLYVWQTKVTEGGAKTLASAIPGLNVERGYDMPPPAPKKEEPKKEEPKKKDAPKKDTPKKDAPKKDAPKKDTPKKDAPKKDAPKKDPEKAPAPKPAGD